MSSSNDSIDVKILDEVLRNLVTSPEEVKIERKVDEQGVLLSVSVNIKDMGIVIGRNGSMAMSIKTVMRAIGKANNMNVRVQFLEPDGSTHRSNGHSESGDNTDKIDSNITSEPKNSNENINLIDDDLSDFVIN